MTTAFVFSGGASLGAIQVGMAAALFEADIRPDLVVGASVGAVNAAWFANGADPAELATIWASMTRSQLFPVSPIQGLQALLGRRPYFVSGDGLRRMLERHIGFGRLEDATIPIVVLTTDARTGEEVVLRQGPAVNAIMASAALPGVFPPVEVEGRVLIDGGVANNTPITAAIEAGATEVWVLSTGFSCALPSPPTGALAMALHSVALLVQQRLVLETTNRDYPVPVHLLPPPCPITITPIDFSQTESLVSRAEAGTRQWLSNGCPHAIPLHVPHDHPVGHA